MWHLCVCVCVFTNMLTKGGCQYLRCVCFLVCICRDPSSDQRPPPHTTGSVLRILCPTSLRSFTTSQRTKPSWRNVCDTWGRRPRTGTTTSGPSRTSRSARFKFSFLSLEKSLLLLSACYAWKCWYCVGLNIIIKFLPKSRKFIRLWINNLQ